MGKGAGLQATIMQLIHEGKTDKEIIAKCRRIGPWVPSRHTIKWCRESYELYRQIELNEDHGFGQSRRMKIMQLVRDQPNTTIESIQRRIEASYETIRAARNGYLLARRAIEAQ